MLVRWSCQLFTIHFKTTFKNEVFLKYENEEAVTFWHVTRIVSSGGHVILWVFMWSTVGQVILWLDVGFYSKLGFMLSSCYLLCYLLIWEHPHFYFFLKTSVTRIVPRKTHKKVFAFHHLQTTKTEVRIVSNGFTI
jgi:hypothetical protein